MLDGELDPRSGRESPGGRARTQGYITHLVDRLSGVDPHAPARSRRHRQHLSRDHAVPDPPKQRLDHTPRADRARPLVEQSRHGEGGLHAKYSTLLVALQEAVREPLALEPLGVAGGRADEHATLRADQAPP
jgi:hypothetical protein